MRSKNRKTRRDGSNRPAFCSRMHIDIWLGID